MKTSSANSGKDAAIKDGGLRLMTAGEIHLAKKVFGDKITYSKVWIHHDSYLPFSLQPSAREDSHDNELEWFVSRL